MNKKYTQNIYIFIIVAIFVTFWWLYMIKNSNILWQYFLEDCNDIVEKDVNVLNKFFLNSWYRWTSEYWCKLVSINPRIAYMSWQTLPKEIWKLVNLTNLNIIEKWLVWEIPTEIWNLRNLELLALRGNNFSWIIPKSLWKLIELKSLDLSDNMLAWEIPKELWNLKKLELLRLSNNELVGIVPKELHSITSIEYIDYKNNKFSE